MNLRILILSILSLVTCHSLAVTGPYVGVVNKADGTASFINLLLMHTEFTVPVGFLPHEITSSPDGRFGYISNYGKDHVRSNSPLNKPGTTLTVVDMETKKVSATLSLGTEPCAPHGIVPSADGQRLYVTCEAREEILVLDLKSQSLHHVPTGQAQSHMVVISPTEDRAYTSNFSSGSVSVMDLKSATLLKVIPTGPGTEGLSMSADGKFVYASSVLGGYLVKIDTAQLEIVGKVSTEKSPVRVIPTPDGKRLVVNCSAAGVLQIFDADTLTWVKNIAVGRQPIGLIVPNNDYAFTAAMLENSVLMINLNTFEIENRFSTGSKPDGIAFIPAR